MGVPPYTSDPQTDIISKSKFKTAHIHGPVSRFSVDNLLTILQFDKKKNKLTF